MAASFAALRVASPASTSRRAPGRHVAAARHVAASAGTMSPPMKASEAEQLAPKVAIPAHPTYSIADAVKLALEEDIADVGDISSLST